jgi:CDP-diacylglycerol--serine O-phosphatidyltransferase
MSTVDQFSKPQHVLADMLTYCNLAAGIAATLLLEEGRPVRRSTLILIGGMCDTVDGTLARRSGNPTEFGAAADGVSDFVSFGIAPAVLLASYGSTPRTLLSRIAPGFYMAAASWRMARNGIGPRTSHVFRGLPVTGAGILFATGCRAGLPLRALTYLAVALGIAMLSPIRVLSGEALVRRNMKTLDIPGVE